MNLRDLLRDLSAYPEEIDHLVECDRCRLSNDWDGVEFERCPDNPVEIERRKRQQPKEQS